MKIPDRCESYKPFRKKKRFKKVSHKTKLTYLSGRDEIDVLLWARYPEYDFIFGVPAKGNDLHGLETGFFQFRDTREKKVWSGFYLDREELDDFVNGFNLISKFNVGGKQK